MMLSSTFYADTHPWNLTNDNRFLISQLKLLVFGRSSFSNVHIKDSQGSSPIQKIDKFNALRWAILRKHTASLISKEDNISNSNSVVIQ